MFTEIADTMAHIIGKPFSKRKRLIDSLVADQHLSGSSHNTTKSPHTEVAFGVPTQSSIAGAGKMTKKSSPYEMTPDDQSIFNQSESSNEGKTANQNLSIAAGSFGLSIIGAFAFPLAIPISMFGMIYIYRHIIISSYNTLLTERKLSIDALVAINTILFLVTGHYVAGNFSTLLWASYAKIMTRITNSSKKEFIDVFKSQPHTVCVLRQEVEVIIPFEDLSRNDIVVIQAGEIIPIDGHIVKGYALVDQKILTGESQPAEKETGDEVYASTIVLSGWLYVHTEKTGGETTSAEIGRILNEAIDSTTNTQLKAEKLIDQSVWPTLLLAGVSYPVFGSIGLMSIIYASPKHRLLIPSSFSVLSHFNEASKQGLLIKDGQALEVLNQVDTIVFDKTGTLTTDQLYVGEIYACPGYTEDDVLNCAAAAEHKQTHPIAKAIQQKAFDMQLELPHISETTYEIGYGLTVIIDKQLVHVGSSKFMERVGITIPPLIIEKQTICNEQGISFVLVAIDAQIAGALELHPTVRPEATAIIQTLRQHSTIESIMIISGDHDAPTKKLSEQLAIDQYFAEVLPEDKADLVTQLQQEGRTVCYIGDGINDAIALQKADVSISLSGASTIATDTAQIILMNQNLEQLEDLFYLSHNLEKNIRDVFTIVSLSSLFAVGGVLFLHLGLGYTIIMSQLGFGGGIIYALKPWLQQNQQRPVSIK